MTDYDALRAAAEAATPGPWGQRVDDVRSIYGGNDELVVDTCGWDRDYDNAAYIAAASPDVVLGLLDRLAEVEGQLDRTEQQIYEPGGFIDAMAERDRLREELGFMREPGHERLYVRYRQARDVALTQRDAIVEAVEAVLADEVDVDETMDGVGIFRLREALAAARGVQLSTVEPTRSAAGAPLATTELDFLHAHVGLGELWQASDRRREVAATLANRPETRSEAPLTAAAPHSDQPDAHDGERGGEAGERA